MVGKPTDSKEETNPTVCLSVKKKTHRSMIPPVVSFFKIAEKTVENEDISMDIDIKEETPLINDVKDEVTNTEDPLNCENSEIGDNIDGDQSPDDPTLKEIFIKTEHEHEKDLKKRKAKEKKVKQEFDKYSKEGYQKDETGEQWCCRFCDRKYYEIRTVLKHEMEFHNDIVKTGINCDQCKFICKDEKRMEAHIASKHTSEFKCDLCDYDAKKEVTGNREIALKVHMIRKHGEHNMEGTKCDKCGIEFATNTSMIAHLRNTHNIVTNDEVKCEVCGKNYARLQFMSHQRYSHGIYPSGFKCILCDKFLNSEKEELDHQTKFHSKDLQCDKCQVNFNSLKAYNDHSKDCLEQPKSFQCKGCNDSYNWFSTKALQIHWAEVHKLHRLICELCGLTAQHKHQYNVHMKKRHSENHKDQCYHCGKSFNLPVKLSIHMNIEHNEDTYCPTCSYCGKKFKGKTTLKHHINAIHEKTTKYPCQSCDFWSYNPKCLKTHVHVKHMNYKTIPCDYCDEKRFVSRRERDKHISSKHPDAVEKILI